MHRRRLALPPAGHRPRPGLWLARARGLGAGAGAPLQSGEAAARSVCPRARGRDPLGRRAARLSHRRGRRRGPDPRRARQRRLHAQGTRGDEPANDGHCAATQSLAEDDHLRGPRARPHHAPSARRRGIAGDLRGPGFRTHGGPSDEARRHSAGAAAGAGLHAGPQPRREGSRELLGLQHARLLRARAALSRRWRAGGDRRGRGPAAPGRHRGDP
jgi:hypothetical protein